VLAESYTTEQTGLTVRSVSRERFDGVQADQIHVRANDALPITVPLKCYEPYAIGEPF
jgi:hypothetical protein